MLEHRREVRRPYAIAGRTLEERASVFVTGRFGNAAATGTAHVHKGYVRGRRLHRHKTAGAVRAGVAMIRAKHGPRAFRTTPRRSRIAPPRAGGFAKILTNLGPSMC